MREVAASPTQLLPVNQIGNNFKSYLQNRGESVQETIKTLEPRATAFPWLFSFVRFLIHRKISLVVLSYSMITNFSIVVFRKRYLTHIPTTMITTMITNQSNVGIYWQICFNIIYLATNHIKEYQIQLALLWEQNVAGSNPVIPTILQRTRKSPPGFEGRKLCFRPARRENPVIPTILQKETPWITKEFFLCLSLSSYHWNSVVDWKWNERIFRNHNWVFLLDCIMLGATNYMGIRSAVFDQ